jgi:hypothetical protein
VVPPRVVVLGVAALLLAGGGAATVAARNRGDGSPAPVSTTVVVTTSTVPSPATTTTVALAPPTTVRPALTTTTARRPATTVTPPAPTSTATTATTRVLDMACAPAQVEVKVTTDKPTYSPSVVVQVASTLRNTSTTTCYYNGYIVRTIFGDGSAHLYPGASMVVDAAGPVALKPGDVLTYSGTWDHRVCAQPGCAPVPAGVYYATVTWVFASFTADVSTSLILS